MPEGAARFGPAARGAVAPAGGESALTDKLNVKLQEYGAIVSLYDTVLNVGYQRLLSYFAVHAALFVGVFTGNQTWEKISLSVAGVAFSILTLLTMEHFKQLLLLRASQAIRLETQINALTPDNDLKVFLESQALLWGREPLLINDASGKEVIKLPYGALGRLVRGRGAVIVEQLASWLILIMWIGTLVSSIYT